MSANFYCWTLNASKRSACSYYRIEVPMGQLSALGYAQVYESAGNRMAQESELALHHADVAHFFSVVGEPVLNKFKAIKKMQPAVRNGNEIYPPALVYDVDDNHDFIHPFNTVFASQGVRGYPDARLLKPGEGLEIVDAEDNPIGAWVDKETFYEETVFDIARNLREMKLRHEIMRTAHAMTVTSEPLAKYVRDVIGVKHVYVFPNTIVPEHYEPIRAVRTDDSVRILWQGGLSHWIDWYPLRDALKTISQKYPNVKFVIFGEWFNWIHENIPDHMVEHHPWVSYDAYKLKRGLLNVDINLCPLVNNVFNAGKSACKWYEASFSGTPEATLAAKFGPYTEIVDGETGLLYDTPTSFVEKLSLLIEDVALRRHVAAGARDWVLANRTPKATIPGLFDFYTEVRARQRRELGKPIIKEPTLEQIKKVGFALR